jgi:hypothetical protein
MQSASSYIYNLLAIEDCGTILPLFKGDGMEFERFKKEIIEKEV